MKHYNLFRIVIVLMSLLTLASCHKKGPSEIPVSSVSLSQTSISLKVGESQTITATISPSGGIQDWN